MCRCSSSTTTRREARWRSAPGYASDRVRFVHEPEPGIAAARNRALDESAGADLLVFIDDDERPEPGWLESLVATWRHTARCRGGRTGDLDLRPGPGAVDHERWLLQPPPACRPGPTSPSRRRTTSSSTSRTCVRPDCGSTSASARAAVPTRCSPSRSTGEVAAWSGATRRAVVDVVPASRLSRKWVLQRAVRTGNSWSRVSVAVEDGLIARTARRLALTAQGLVRVIGGASRLALGTVTRSLTHRARGARTLARGVGMTSGAWGYQYAEYRRPASSQT